MKLVAMLTPTWWIAEVPVWSSESVTVVGIFEVG